MSRAKSAKDKFSPSHARNVRTRVMNWPALMRYLGGCLSVGVCAGLLSWGYFRVTDPSTFPVNTVKIVGEYHKVDKRVLKEVIGPYVSANFFNVDVAAIKAQVDELPWVANSIVEKAWPDQVVVKFVEHHPIGRWNEDGLFTEKKEIFYPPKQSLAAYPLHLNGPEGYFNEVLENYVDMAQALRALGLKITDLSLEPRQAWRLRLNNGIELILGKNDHRARLMRFIRSYPGALSSRSTEIDTVDLRYASGMAVRWKTLVRDAGD